MNKPEKATAYFRNSFNCSQSVLAVFAPSHGISEDSALKIACAFGAGMGRQQMTCGAVTGALMALGLKYGKGLNDDEGKKKDTYARTTEFCNQFTKLHGTLNCRELLSGLDLNNPDDYKRIVDQGMFTTHCEKYVTTAVSIMDKIINKETL